MGSPFNVSPGSQANLSHVIAHYQRVNDDQEALRVKRANAGETSIYE
jgi:hypothetical protein